MQNLFLLDYFDSAQWEICKYEAFLKVRES